MAIDALRTATHHRRIKRFRLDGVFDVEIDHAYDDRENPAQEVSDNDLIQWTRGRLLRSPQGTAARDAEVFLRHVFGGETLREIANSYGRCESWACTSVKRGQTRLAATVGHE